MVARRLPYMIVVFALIIFNLAIVASPVAGAQEPATGFTIGVEPDADPTITEHGYFVFPSEPGATETGVVRLSNPTDDGIIVELTAVDAMTANNGGSAFATGDVALSAIGMWLTFDESRITLEPGAEQLVEFTVEVPAQIEPGQYLAGLAAAAVEEETPSTPIATDGNAASASVDLRTRYVIAVEIDIAGDWPASLVIDEVAVINQPSGPIVGITLQNDGASFLHPSGTLELTDAAGEVVLSHTIEMGTFVTGTSVTYPIALNRTLAPGDYLVAVELAYGDDDQMVRYDDTLTVGEITVSAVTISNLTVDEVRSATDEALQFVTIAVGIENPAAAVANARVTLHVTLDGALVEDVVLSDAITVQPGAAQISQRYLPLTGWEPGVYAFSVTIAEVNPESGAVVELAGAQSETTVTVP